VKRKCEVTFVDISIDCASNGVGFDHRCALGRRPLGTQNIIGAGNEALAPIARRCPHDAFSRALNQLSETYGEPNASSASTMPTGRRRDDQSRRTETMLSSGQPPTAPLRSSAVPRPKRLGQRPTNGHRAQTPFNLPNTARSIPLLSHRASAGHREGKNGAPPPSCEPPSWASLPSI
jgi:hypothetical protein